MKKRLSSSIGTRISRFDDYDNPTVLMFNAMFPECPLQGYDNDAIVHIGLPSSGNCRDILVGDTQVRHKMYSDILYGMDRDKYHQEHEQEADELMGYPV